MRKRPALSHPNPRGFDDVDTLVFDLDNTLYPSACNLFAQVDQNMGDYVANLLGLPFAEARKLQKKYYWEHGTTLAGLMSVHKIDPEHFLARVHDIDYSPVPHAPDLVEALAALDARKIVFTNGSRRHAEQVLARLGLSDAFEAIFDITDAAYVPKPRDETYQRFAAAHGIVGERSAMFEDLPQNLVSAHGLGMTTVLIHSDLGDHPVHGDIRGWTELPDHVHHHTDDLAGFLTQLR